MRRLAGLLSLVLAAACGPAMRDAPVSRYQGMLLAGNGLGPDALESWKAGGDPTLSQYLLKAGPPDFVFVGGPDTLELIYVQEATVVVFRRPAPGEPSEMGEKSPIPATLSALLPSNLAAQTPASMRGLGVYCWRVPLGDEEYRACCKAPVACSGEWQKTR